MIYESLSELEEMKKKIADFEEFYNKVQEIRFGLEQTLKLVIKLKNKK